jgi:hypothetical protein
MRLFQIGLVIPAVLIACSAVSRGDDTADFLKPENWEGRSDIWKLEKGTLVGETKGDLKENTFFCSKQKYSDFELSFKVKLMDGVGNSGVQIRSEVFDKEKFRVRGPQADIGQQYWGSLYGEGVGGMMKASDAATVKKVVKEKDVNDYKIVAKGTKITVIINGEKMVDGDFPKLPGRDAKDSPTEGIIAFQAHTGPKMKVEYTDIKFTKLSK